MRTNHVVPLIAPPVINLKPSARRWYSLEKLAGC